MTVLAAILALIVGLTLGLLGGGGSILTVPVLVWLGQDPKTAIVMSLPIVGGASLVGAARHWRMGNIDLRGAVPFGLTTMAGAYGGAKLGHFLSGGMQLRVLAVLMFAAAVAMFRNAGGNGTTAAAVDPSARHFGPAILVVGMLTGVLTGLVGIGGGFLLVPALVLLAKVPMKQAVGTTLLVIAMNAAAGSLGYHGEVAVPWTLVLYFAAFTAVGIIVGTALLPKVSQAVLKRGFSVLLVLVAGFLLFGR